MAKIAIAFIPVYIYSLLYIPITKYFVLRNIRWNGLKSGASSSRAISWLAEAQKLYIREYTSGNIHKIWNQGYCLQTALNTSFALLSRLAIRRQFWVCFWLQSQLLNLTHKPDVYSLQLYILCSEEPPKPSAQGVKCSREKY